MARANIQWWRRSSTGSGAPPKSCARSRSSAHLGQHMADGLLLELKIDRSVRARYVDGAGTAPTSAPRPFLHPVLTPAGTAVTDARPADHDWHLGAGVALQDVAGYNLWGGRTYIRGRGYEWHDDHGRIEHRGWAAQAPGHAVEDLEWLDTAGRGLLRERRELAWGALGSHAWWLELGFALSPAGAEPVRLGSPGAAGRPGGGYGGFFWRLPPCEEVDVRGPGWVGERASHGRVAPWLVWSATTAGRPFTLVFLPCDERSAADPWFVRVAGYPGVGSALA